MSDTGESSENGRGHGRKRQEEWMRELADEEWNMHTLLEAHAGLVNRRHKVRHAAYFALLSLAEKEPEPVKVTPLALLRRYIGSVTSIPGAAQQVYRYLVDADTRAADRLLRDVLQNTDPMKNKDFEHLVEYLVENQEDEYMQILEASDLSNAKGKIFRQVKREAEGEE